MGFRAGGGAGMCEPGAEELFEEVFWLPGAVELLEEDPPMEFNREDDMNSAGKLKGEVARLSDLFMQSKNTITTFNQQGASAPTI